MSVLSYEFLFENPPFAECHAATIESTPKGLIAAFFAGTHERHVDTGIWTVQNTGNGWEDLHEVANGVEPDGNRYPSWNPVLFQMPGAELILFYKVGPSPDNWWGYLKRSSDGGETWSEAERLPDGILGPIKNKPLLLDDGTLLCPSSKESQADGWQVFIERTNDAGKTWEISLSINDGRKPGAIQPTLIDWDGTIYAYNRTRGEGYISVSHSKDRGVTWGEMQKSELPNPNSGIDAVRLSDGRILLIYNHVITPPGQWSKRYPIHLAVATKPDEWEAALVLESEPGEYSYPAIIQTDDAVVHILYTWKRTNIRYIAIHPENLPTKPIVNGEWPEGVPHA